MVLKLLLNTFNVGGWDTRPYDGRASLNNKLVSAHDTW
jgi:hypothetical protein